MQWPYKRGLYFVFLKEKGPSTGYEVCKIVSELTGGIYKPSSGATYPALKTLGSRAYRGKKLMGEQFIV